VSKIYDVSIFINQLYYPVEIIIQIMGSREVTALELYKKTVQHNRIRYDTLVMILRVVKNWLQACSLQINVPHDTEQNVNKKELKINQPKSMKVRSTVKFICEGSARYQKFLAGLILE